MNNEIIEFVITSEDFDKSSKDYGDKDNCPLATAAKRFFQTEDIIAGVSSIYDGSTNTFYDLEVPFDFNNFLWMKLKRMIGLKPKFKVNLIENISYDKNTTLPY